MELDLAERWPNALPSWLERARPMIYRSVYCSTKSKQLAEDVAQETVLIMLEKFKNYDFPAFPAFLNCLLKIARRNAWHRDKNDRRYRPLPPTTEPVTETSDPDSTLVASSPEFVECLALLDDERREIVRLRFEEGKIFQEIVDELKIAAGTAFNRVRGALASLRLCLASKGVFGV